MAERRFTDLELERKLAGDLSPARAAALDKEATDADRARLAELETQSQAFLASVDLDLEVRRIEQRADRLRPPRRAWLRWLVPAGALAAAAAAILVFFSSKKAPQPDDRGSDDLMTKGDDISLVIHAAADGNTARLATGDTITPGTRLRFEVQGSKPGFIAVIGLDGSNATTIYYPGPGASEAGTIGADRLLPGAIQIDATPGDEQFFAVFSARPFAIATVMAAVHGTSALPHGIAMSHVVLHKK